MKKRQEVKSTDLDEVNLEILTKRTRDLARRSSEETDRQLADFLARGDAGEDLEIQGTTSADRMRSLRKILKEQSGGA